MTPTKTSLIFDRCQTAIGYRFRNLDLLKAALTHTSGANSRAASNERLEFFGDSVLALVTCELLFHLYPNYDEGDMTKVKSSVVSRKTCAKFSQELGLGAYLIVGKGVMDQGDIPSNMLANVFESLVAAIHIDGGWDVAKKFVSRFVEPEIKLVADDAINNNAKSALQQVAQREYGGTPRYYMLDEQGPDHDKCFKVSAEVNDHYFPAAWGRTKKEAELRAAMNALADIAGDPTPYPSN